MELPLILSKQLKNEIKKHILVSTRERSSMDPFEQSILSLLESRKKVAEKIVAARAREELSEQEVPLEESSIQDRLPYSISKTVQYLKADEYQRQKKALKKQTETI